MERESDSVTYLIAQELAQREGVQPHELDYSLYDCVNTEAIELLLTSHQSDWELTFQVPEHCVTVRGTGEIEIDGEIVHKGSDDSLFEE